jgi:hypothetical protein
MISQRSYQLRATFDCTCIRNWRHSAEGIVALSGDGWLVGANACHWPCYGRVWRGLNAPESTAWMCAGGVVDASPPATRALPGCSAAA